MNRKELEQFLEKYPGTASRIKTIFDYHYDAIQREIHQEIQEMSESSDFEDSLVQIMEEEMNWPYGDTQEDFNTSLVLKLPC